MTREKVRSPLTRWNRSSPVPAVGHEFKTVDGVGKDVVAAAAQGGPVAACSGVASAASLRGAVQAATDSGVRIICDLYAAPAGPRRAREVEGLGVDSAYIH